MTATSGVRRAGGRRGRAVALAVFAAVIVAFVAGCGGGGNGGFLSVPSPGAGGGASASAPVTRQTIPQSPLCATYCQQLRQLRQDQCAQPSLPDPSSCETWLTTLNTMASRMRQDPQFGSLPANIQNWVTNTIPTAYRQYNDPQDQCTQPSNPQAAVCKLPLANANFAVNILFTYLLMPPMTPTPGH